MHRNGDGSHGTWPWLAHQFLTPADGIQDGETGPPGELDGPHVATMEAATIQLSLAEVAILDGTSARIAGVVRPMAELTARQAPFEPAPLELGIYPFLMVHQLLRHLDGTVDKTCPLMDEQVPGGDLQDEGAIAQRQAGTKGVARSFIRQFQPFIVE